MSNDLHVWKLIMDASLVVQAVMLLLLGASVASWMIIFRKRALLHQAEKAAEKFEERFWSGTDLTSLYNQITHDQKGDRGMARLFKAGFEEFNRLREQGRVSPERLVQGAERAMNVALTRETDHLEHRLSFLATVGSTSPYVGLFGTVWGIMTSFQALANVNQATIAMVAPGISEALIATAMGLFAAIPAVIAYNKYSNQVERLELRLENFKEEFSSILNRQALAVAGS